MTTPHLPVAQKARSANKTILLWLLLILMFVSIYQLFSGPPPSSHPHTAPPPDHFWNSISALVTIGFGLLMWRLVAWGRASRRFNGEDTAAQTLLARGQLAEAGAQFEAMAKRYRWRSLRMAAEHSLAVVELRQGQIDRALDRLAAQVKKPPGIVIIGDTRRTALLHLAIGYAIKGDVTAAQAWLDAFNKMPGPLNVRTQLAITLLELRRGNFDAVAKDLESRWRELEQQLTGDGLRPLRLLRAFAVAHLTTRDAELAPTFLQPLGAGAREELMWLGAAWPELAQFIAAHL
jgi:hypothetical protein